MRSTELKIAAFPGRYMQGAGAFSSLPVVMAKYGSRPFWLVTRSMLPAARALADQDSLAVEIERFGGECCDTEIERVLQLAAAARATAIAAIGGGKVIDCGKIIADRLNVPVVIVPTIASTDAPCSGCAVVYTDDGIYDHVYYQKRNPDVVLMDSAIIASAPVRFLISGMGDGMATFFEANACQRSGSPSECGGLQSITALTIARLCLDTILEYGRQAVQDCRQGQVTAAVEAIIEANTLLSGIGFESCGLAAAHSVHNGLTLLSGTHSRYHGEKVAFGVLTGLQFNDALNLRDVVYEFFLDVGLPVCFADLGIADVTPGQLEVVARDCCTPGHFMEHEPASVDVATLVASMQAADAYGRMKKARSNQTRL